MLSIARLYWRPYAAAVGSILLASLASTVAVRGPQDTGLLFAIFFGAVTFASWYGGLGPGVLATLLSYLVANWLFVEPRDKFVLSGTVLAYFFVCLAIAAFSEAMRQAVKQATLNARQIASILESMPDGFVALDSQRRFTYLNPGAHEIHMRHQPEATGPPLWHEFPPTSGTLAEARLREVEELRANVEFEHYFAPWQTWFEVKIAPASRGGSVIYFRDITARKQAQDEQRKLAAIVDSSEDAILSVDLNGVITSWNIGAELLYGYTAAEAVGRPVSILVTPEQVEEQTTLLEKIKRDESVLHFDTLRVAKDGRRIPVSLSVSPIRSGDGQVIGAAKIARDITERKRTEELLRDADRRKDNFLAVLGHELRNPLAGIVSGVQVMEFTDSLPDEMVEVREIMKRQATQMSRLIDDLLDVARIARGKITLRKEHVDLVSLARQITDDLRIRLSAKPMELVVDLPRDEVWVEGDPVRLSQVLGNLVDNAVKFTGESGRIEIHVRTDENRRAVVEVRDTGAGLPLESRATLFEPFSQASETLSHSPMGLGLGLALVKGLIDMHGGTVSADSKGPGTGSTFTVTLPLASAPSRAAETSPSSAAGATRCRGLIIEDNEDVSRAFSRMLELSGHQVAVAHDGPSGVELAREFQPDIVFCDIGLGGGMDGYDVARALRAQESTKSTYLVAVTGLGQDDDRRRAADAGFDRHLTKPANRGELLAVMAEATAARAPAAGGC
jgi:two-component system CheB/CheR fusion protein